MNILDEVRSIVSRVRDGGLDPAEETERIDVEIGRIPGVETTAGQHRFDEFVVEVGVGEHLRAEAEALAWVQTLRLTSAPEVVALLPTAEGFVIVRRYWACPGERLIAGESAHRKLSSVARSRFRSEMERLAQHGKLHAYARGTEHWWVAERTGTIVLDSWFAIRPCRERERDELFETIDQRLAERAKNRVLEMFGTTRVLLPVIHPIGRSEALESLRIIQAAGVKGAFLIDQGMPEAEVLRLVMEARDRFPTLWIGVNLLARRPAEALKVALDACGGHVDGIWADNAGIDENAREQLLGQEFLRVRAERDWNGLYFGGVAFKYQREVAAWELQKASALAANYMDVICTSGPGTGRAAAITKIRAMRDGAGNSALGLASGVTADNVGEYVPFVNAYLVGTGIEARFGVLDPAKLDAVLRAIG